LRKHLYQPKRTEIKNFFHILILLFLYSSTRLSINELVLIPLEQAGYDNFYAYAEIERVETQWSENDFKGSSKASENEKKKLNRMVQTKKKWLYKP